ncbi:MAG: hypothetical protein HYW49_02695 [Deltaproteobacteria bacterium]|nr:hypothetical protein [Deltaproteobacteria bacterium]
MKFSIGFITGLCVSLVATLCLAGTNDRGFLVKKKKDAYIDCRVTVTDKNGKILKGIAFNTQQVTSWKGAQAGSRFPAIGGRPLFLNENYGLLWMNENFSAKREANLIQRLLKKDKVTFSEDVTVALTKPFNKGAFDNEIAHADELQMVSRSPVKYVKVSATASGGNPKKTYVPELDVYVASVCDVYVPGATEKSASAGDNPAVSDAKAKSINESAGGSATSTKDAPSAGVPK